MVFICIASLVQNIGRHGFFAGTGPPDYHCKYGRCTVIIGLIIIIQNDYAFKTNNLRENVKNDKVKQEINL